MEGGGEESKGVVVVAVTKTPDKTKRDEWSEGGIMSLLDVYETKWALRNRAKLKGSDWEDIAGQVSARNCGTKPGKTPNQCKNKIEAMKKRYRSESAVNNHSGSGQSWQFYARMDRLVKGTHSLQPKVGDVVGSGVTEMEGLQALPNSVGDLENDIKRVDDNGPVHVQVVETARNFKTIDELGQNHVQVVEKARNSKTIDERDECGQNRVQVVEKARNGKTIDERGQNHAQFVEKARNCKTIDERGQNHVQVVEKARNGKTIDERGQNHVQVVEKARNGKTIDERGQNHVQDDNQDDGSNTVPNNSEFSTPRNKAARVAERSLKINSFKRKKRSGSDMAESVRVLAHSMLKIEQARMEMYRDSERLRVEADIKRAEMDLKRTEIIAKTQLQIAKLFVKRTCIHNNKSGNSSMVAEHNVATNAEERNG